MFILYRLYFHIFMSVGSIIVLCFFQTVLQVSTQSLQEWLPHACIGGAEQIA